MQTTILLARTAVVIFVGLTLSCASSSEPWSASGDPPPSDTTGPGAQSNNGDDSGGTSPGGTNADGTDAGGTNSGDGDGGGTNSANTTNTGCISDRIEIPTGDGCVCQFDNCDATQVTCSCALSCYGAADCLVNADGDGTAATGDGFLGDCNISCTPEDDLSEEMLCSASDCTIEPNSTSIAPASAPAEAPATSIERERGSQAVDVVFVVDNSGSMEDNQMATACAMDAFTSTASANNASFQTGVLTTDMFDESGHGIYDEDSGAFRRAPGLVSLAGSCSSTLTCGGNCEATFDNDSVCRFSQGGELVPSDAPGAQELLSQLIVQGDDGSGAEGGLEVAFQYYANLEKKGQLDIDAPKEIVVISDEDADARKRNTDTGWLCPFSVPDRNTAGIPNFNPPTPTGTRSSCKQDLADFYTYYFTSRNFIVHGLLFKQGCSNDSTESVGQIYEAVIAATGGHTAPICECGSFDSFFTDVGGSTSTLSTELCFAGAMPDPDTIQVFHVETGDTVPRSTQDGWTLHDSLNCIVMTGSWKDVTGKFRIDFIDPDAPPPPPGDPVACLGAGVDPLVDTIVVTCNGRQVPDSATNGYTFDPATDCFTFHGSFRDVDGGTCTVDYL